MFRFPYLAVVSCAHFGISIHLVCIPIHLFSSTKWRITIILNYLVCLWCECTYVLHILQVKSLIIINRSTLVKLMKMLFRFIVSSWFLLIIFFLFGLCKSMVSRKSLPVIVLKCVLSMNNRSIENDYERRSNLLSSMD